MDHDQPAGAVQRLPRRDRRRAASGVPAGVGRPAVRAVDPHRRRREGVLHRRRREAARRDRRLRPDRERPVRDRHLHKLIRDIPKPVIAAVNGVAVGGGHVLHVLCDLSIAAETARFGQAGPRVGSFDAGFGSAYLARVVGEKRAREIWISVASTTRRRGTVGPGQRGRAGRAAARPRCGPGRTRSLAAPPTALKVLKQSFNADTEHFAGVGQMAFEASSCSAARPRPRRASPPSTRSVRPTSRPTVDASSHSSTLAEPLGFDSMFGRRSATSPPHHVAGPAQNPA